MEEVSDIKYFLVETNRTGGFTGQHHFFFFVFRSFYFKSYAQYLKKTLYLNLPPLLNKVNNIPLSLIQKIFKIL